MFENKIMSRVLLPQKMFDEARDKEHFKELLANYMRTCYPNYVVKSVKDGFAWCERRD